MQVVEHGQRALDPFFVALGPSHQPFQHRLHTCSLGALELLVLEIEVVNDLGDGPHALVGKAHAADQRLERAAILFVREIAADHVEPELAVFVLGCWIGKAETCFGVDEAADEPGRGHSIDLDSGTCNPGPVAQLGIGFQHSCLLLPVFSEACFDRCHGLLGFFPSAGVEEIDAPDFVKTAGQPGLGCAQLSCRCGAAGRLHCCMRFSGDGLVVSVPRFFELSDGRLAGNAVDKVAVEQVSVASACSDLLSDPLQVLEGLSTMRKQIDGVLDCYGARAGEPLPDLGPEIEGAGRDAMNEDEPARHSTILTIACQLWQLLYSILEMNTASPPSTPHPCPSPRVGDGKRKTVLFLCPYGGAKSVIAASYFNRLISETSLPFVAVAASAETPYDSVPGPVADLLEQAGFAVRDFKPRRVDSGDIRGAQKIVSIDCDLGAVDLAGAEVERWDDVPKVSEDLAGSAAAIRKNVETLASALRRESEGAGAIGISGTSPPLRALVLYFLRLGTLGFGGPIALAGAMQRNLVEERRWVSADEYMKGLALAQLAPGPLAAQLAIYIGWARSGVLGATLVALAFIAPSFVMVLGISAAYVRFGGLAWMQSAFYGIGAAVIAVILRSAYKLVRLTLGRDALLWLIFVANAVATAVMEAEVVSLILASGIVSLAVRFRQDRAVSALAILPPLAAVTGGAPLAGSLFWFFAKAGAFVFGSGLAIVPFLYGGVVREHQWLTDQQFLDAVAVAMITPGPVVITVAFIGYLVAGMTGAVTASLGVFLPCYLFVVLPAPYYARFADNPRLRAFVVGVTAAATGAIGGAVIVLARRAIIDVPTALIFAGTLSCLVWLKRLPEPVLIAIVGIASVALAE